VNTRLAGIWLASLAACASSNVAPTGAPASDAGRPDHQPIRDEDTGVDAGRRDAGAQSDGDTGARGDAHLESMDAAIDAARPLSPCEAVTPSPAIGCGAALPLDFMCAVTEADLLTSLGCTWKDVVGSGELLACCPPCPHADGGACYQ
jgi:hypothetical protein